MSLFVNSFTMISAVGKPKYTALWSRIITTIATALLLRAWYGKAVSDARQMPLQLDEGAYPALSASSLSENQILLASEIDLAPEHVGR